MTLCPFLSWLSRFDLIYLVLDKFDEEKDRRLARHLISLYHEGATGAARQNSHVVSEHTSLQCFAAAGGGWPHWIVRMPQ
jgi:DNA replicative helicase MCM subunit Mcm2 (Cdc46/Mcm family)